MEHCKNCSKVYKLKSSLARHLATTSCGQSPRKEYECEHCTYTTPIKNTFTRHVASCKYVYAAQQLEEIEKEKQDLCDANQAILDEKDKILENLKEKNRENQKNLKEKDGEIKRIYEEKDMKIKMLRQKIKDLKEENIAYRLQLEEKKGRIVVYKERPSTVNNNTYINPKLLQVKCNTIRPFTVETVREDVQAGKFTFERFIKAEKGLIEFISDIIAKDTEFSYVCTDSSRQKFHRLLESREWKDDNGATFLNKVLDELKEPTTEYYRRITDMMVNGDRDTADFLRAKTKPMVMGITCPSSKDREATFTKVRNEVKKLATV